VPVTVPTSPIERAQVEFDDVKGMHRVGLLGEDAVMSMIESGVSHTEIAQIAGCPRSSVGRWLRADSGRSARADEAMERAAGAFDDLAQKTVQNAPDAFELMKAKELALHYRWRAKSYNPAKYGDRTTLAGDKNAPIELRSKQEIATTLSMDELMAIALKGRLEKSKQ
jgi:predicted transcriptional regulator